MYKNIADFCKLYQEFADWQNYKLKQGEDRTPKWKRVIYTIFFMKKKKYRVVIPMTMSQARFANFLLENVDDISSIGNLESIFEEVRNFIRHKSERKNKSFEQKE